MDLALMSASVSDSDQTQPPPNRPADGFPAGHPTLVSTALKNLSQLASEFARRNSTELSRHRTLIEDLSNKYRVQSADLETRLTISLQQHNRQFDQAWSQGTAQFDADRRAIEEELDNRLEAARNDHARSVNQVRDKVREQCWLADSLLEAALAESAQATKQNARDLDNHLAELNAQDAAMFEVAQRFSRSDLVQAAAEDEDPAPPVADAASSDISDSTGFSTQALAQHYADSVKQIQTHLAKLEHLHWPTLFVGLTPYVFGFLGVALIGGAGWLAATFLPTSAPGPSDSTSPFAGYNWAAGGIVAGVGLLLISALGIAARIKANRSVDAVWKDLRSAMRQAKQAAYRLNAATTDAIAQRKRHAAGTRDVEVQAAKLTVEPLTKEATQRLEAAIMACQAERTGRLTKLQRERAKWEANQKQQRQQQLEEIQSAAQMQKSQLDAAYARNTQTAESDFQQQKTQLVTRWQQAVQELTATASADIPSSFSFHQLVQTSHPALGRLGFIPVDIRRFLVEAPVQNDSAENNDVQSGRHDDADTASLPVPPPFVVPLCLAVPDRAHLLIETTSAHRRDGIDLLKLAMLRLLLSFPPGQVRFVLMDPVGLGESFGEILHLADYDDRLIGSRAWTQTDQIEQRLADLAEHMETVIQKYLRNEFANIDQYNAQAGVLAEPQRFLVISDFPSAFSSEAMTRLRSILASGQRCGVHVLMHCTDSNSSAWADLISPNTLHLQHQAATATWLWQQPGQTLEFQVDESPEPQEFISLVKQVGAGALQAARVEVPFTHIAPDDHEVFSKTCDEELAIPVGRSGASRFQSIRLGRGVAQHMLVAGKTGSGKSTLLNAMIVSGSLWFSPEELEFYLVDFKKGVEFKPYATMGLPHVKVVAVESEREFGLSVLQRLDAELSRRGELYRQAGAQDVASYRQKRGNSPLPRLPRTLLIIDEFQEFYSEDDKLAQEASLLLDRLIRQGRAFGMHVILGSQTIGGSASLPRATLGQMAVRVALQTNEVDSHLILGEGNAAARLLSRPGEAIYNDAGGAVEANSPFQVCWLSETTRQEQLQRVIARAGKAKDQVVFEGGDAPDPLESAVFKTAEASGNSSANTSRLLKLYVGMAVAIKPPTHVPISRRSGCNVLLVGQNEMQAAGMLSSAVRSLGVQVPYGQAVVHLVDGSPADSPVAGVMAAELAKMNVEHKVYSFREAADAVAGLHEELLRRQEAANSADDTGTPSLFLLLPAVQRFRIFRKSEDAFSFSASFSASADDEAKPKVEPPDKMLSELLRDGPTLGIHVIAWVDTLAGFERTFDRMTLREFDLRLMLQMSAADSTTLIDSSLANRLGPGRALAYSEEAGTMEKFRPFKLSGR